MSGNPSTSSTGSGTGTSGVGGPCGACKFLRRKCVVECIFAPYFVSEQGAAHFAAVHKVFGASNVTKLLMHIPVNKRLDAVITLSYEAQARIRDPVYGCVAQIFALQQQVANLQAELSYFQAHLATLETVAPSPPPPLPQIFVPTAGLSITDLPTAMCLPSDYDLSSLLDPTLQPSSWTMQRIHTPAEMSPPQGDDGSGDGNVQELARFVAVPCSSGTSFPLHGK